MSTAVAGPPLAIGGVHPPTILAFIVVIGALWLRLCLRRPGGIAIPRWSWIGMVACAATLLQWAPIPGLRHVLAPNLDLLVRTALAHTPISPWPGLSPTPADTGIEAARLVALLLLFMASSQFGWRIVTAIVAGLGTTEALIAFAQQALGIDDIYGLYVAHQVDLSGVPALLGTFVNPNHQSGLLLLGIFCALALAADQYAHALVASDPGRVERYGDRFLAAAAAVSIQIPALLLSLSRGAILALAVTIPFAVLLTRARIHATGRSGSQRSARMSVARIVTTLFATGLLILVVQSGPWRELTTLSSFAGDGWKLQPKVRHVLDSFQLVSLSPILGVGRGAFVDLFPAVRSDASHALATHLECAPAAMLIEWGPWIGGLILVGCTGWWVSAMRHGGRGADRHARRIVLLGLLAVAGQNLADYAFELLGVAAPAIALAGTLCPGNRRSARPRAAAVIGVVVLACAAIVVALYGASAQTAREAVNATVIADASDGLHALSTRPLDGRLHEILARKAANHKSWDKALHHAQVAVDRQPHYVDGWLLLGAARNAHNDREGAREAITHGLDQLHALPQRQLIEWLIAEFPRPQDFARITPEAALPWRLLIEATAPVSLAHADAVAAVRAYAHRDDPAPLRMRHQLAIQAHNAPLALHFARLLAQVAPEDVRTPLALAQAYTAFSPPRDAEARDELEQALALEHFEGDAEQGLLEHTLLITLMRIADAASITRARELAPALLKRPTTRQGRQAREALVRELNAVPTNP